MASSSRIYSPALSYTSLTTVPPDETLVPNVTEQPADNSLSMPAISLESEEDAGGDVEDGVSDQGRVTPRSRSPSQASSFTVVSQPSATSQGSSESWGFVDHRWYVILAGTRTGVFHGWWVVHPIVIRLCVLINYVM